jgi:nicotinamide riboside transporter PnuC
MFTIEFALLIMLAVSWAVRRQPGPSHYSRPGNFTASAVLFATAAGFIASGLLFAVHQQPHGDWDAFAIWNSHARYLYRDGPAWQSHIQNTFHPDYPLLVPSLNARVWRYLGREVHDTGGWLGLIFSLSGLAVILATVAELRNRRLAMLIGLVLLATPFYLTYGVSQSADVPLAYFFLSVTTLLCLHWERGPGQRGLLVLAGFMAGCAGWTKNEGLMFVMALCIALLLSAPRSLTTSLRHLGLVSVGLLLPILVVLFFKLAIAPQGELFANRESSELFEMATAPDRYLTVVSSLSASFWTFGDWAVNPVIPLLAFIGLCGVDRQVLRTSGWLVAAATLALVGAGYFAVYVLAPYDLKWFLDNSAPRLFLQLWPSSLLLAGLVAVQYPHAR